MRALIFLFLFSQLLTQIFGDKEPLDMAVSTVYDEVEKRNSLSIETKILNDYLIFEKFGKIYKAKYMVKMEILDDENNIIWSKIKRKEIDISNFNYTNSIKKSSLLLFKAFLKGGNYRIKVKVFDERNNRFFSKTEKIEVLKDTKSGVKIENVTFYDTVNKKLIKKSSLVFEKNNEDIQLLFSINKKENITKDFIKLTVKNSKNEVLYHKTKNLTILTDSQKLYRIRFSKSALISDEKFIVGLQVLDSAKKLLTFLRKTIYLNLSRYPESKNEMKYALERMGYIAENDSIDFYKNEPIEKSLKYLKRFWLGLSEKNSEDNAYQIMREYFRRIVLSNRQFSSRNRENGWLSDRGRIFIKFGQPDEVLNYPFQADSKPYIVWHYYDLRKRFIFIDNTGFNDYRLTASSRRIEFN